MEIYGFQDDTHMDGCRVGSYSVLTVSVNKSIFSSLTHRSMCCSTTVALFLHPYIFNQIYSRMIVVAAFLLFGESGTEALILLAHKKHLRSAVKRGAWVDASKYPKTFSSINFWTCLASPLTTLIWWVIPTACRT